jgi:hypothetical protein
VPGDRGRGSLRAMHLRGVVVVSLLSACGSSHAPATHPASPAAPRAAITVPSDVRDELSRGLPVALDLREVGSARAPAVATCTVTFDLFDEIYVVRRPGGGTSRSPDVARVLMVCLDAPLTTALVASIAPPPPADPLKRRYEPTF